MEEWTRWKSLEICSKRHGGSRLTVETQTQRPVDCGAPRTTLLPAPPPTNPDPGSDSPIMVRRQLGPRMVSGSSLLTATTLVGDRRRHCCERRAAAATPPFDVGGFALCVCVCVWRSSTSRLLPRATTPTMVPQPQPSYHTTTTVPHHNHNSHHGTTPQPTRPHKVHSSCSILRYYLNNHHLFYRTKYFTI